MGSASIHLLRYIMFHEFSSLSYQRMQEFWETIAKRCKDGKSLSFLCLTVLLFGLPIILQLLPLANLTFVCKSWLMSLMTSSLKLIQDLTQPATLSNLHFFSHFLSNFPVSNDLGNMDLRLHALVLKVLENVRSSTRLVIFFACIHDLRQRLAEPERKAFS